MTHAAPILSNRPASLHLEQALLPWEDAMVFRAFHQALLDDLSPVGATELLLVDQVAWAEWRRRRLMLAERSLHMETLHRRSDPDPNDALTRRALITRPWRKRGTSSDECVKLTMQDDAEQRDDFEQDEIMTRRALARLEEGGPEAYAEAFALLRADTRDWWTSELEDEAHADTDQVEALRAFLVKEVLAWFETARADLAERPEIRLQAFGESLDARRADQLHALDERLQRQVQKALASLYELQARRQNRAQMGRRLG